MVYSLRANPTQETTVTTLSSFHCRVHLLLCTTCQVTATVKFPHHDSRVTMPADKCMLLRLTWMWLSCCGGQDDNIKHIHPHQFSYSKGKPHNILEVEIFNLSLIEQSIRFSSPLLCTDAFQALLFCKTLAVAQNYFSAEAFNAHQENSSTEGTVPTKVMRRRFLRDLQEFSYVQNTLAHLLHAFCLHSPKAAR